MRTPLTFAIRVSTFTAVVLAAVPAAAQTSPVSDARVKELTREALALVQAASPQPQTPATPPAPGTVVALGIEEAVARALERNLDIAVERLNPQTFDLSLASLRSAYSPTLTSTIGKNDLVQLPTNTLTGGTRVQNDTVTYNAGATQLVPWGGGSFSSSFNNNKIVTTSANANFNPQFRSTFNASYTQPLMRGFRIDSTRQQLLVTRLNRDISEVQLRATMTSTLANVRNAYWDYLFALEAVDVARRSMQLAEKLVEDNKVRVEVGTMAPIDVVQAEAEAATRRQVLVSAEAAMRTTELSLKRLIVSGTDDPLWRATIDPIDRPTFQAVPIDLESAVRSALDKRTDLAQARMTLQSNNVSLRFLRDQTLPVLDAVASYGLQGIGGLQRIRVDPRRADSEIEREVPGNYFDALRLIGNRDFPTWNVSLNLSYPLGRSAAQANYARARVQLRQSQAQLKALELTVATEVANAALQVQSNRQRVEAATAARELALRRLEAEASKFEVGMSTNFFVVQAQRDLSDAQNAELRALLDYRKSLVDFERVQETSLSRAGITVVGGGGGGAATTGTRTTGTGGTGGGGAGTGGGGFGGGTP
jgi:outer membrane protein